MHKIVIADDHALVRRGLRALLAAQPDMLPVVEVNDGASLLEAIAAERFDLVLLDVSMPNTNALELVATLRSRHPNLPVLMLSGHPEDQLAIRLIRAGAAGYVSKSEATDQLLAAIRRVLGGGKWVGVELAEQLASRLQNEDQPRHATLSDREFEVLRGLASGRTATELADDLGLSVKTISTYRSRILDKLGLDTTADMIRYALANDLVAE
ncbi:MAG: response regulator transcription factor [Myxococcales bacterium]|nr:response regulator transcription factor [Myxococcales bacterium]